jgi:hypothetical protein
MTTNTTKAFLPAALFLAAIATTHVSAQQTSRIVKAVELTGLPGVGENAKGTLSVSNGNLHFVHGKATSDVSAGVIQEIVSGMTPKSPSGRLWAQLAWRHHTEQAASLVCSAAKSIRSPWNTATPTELFTVQSSQWQPAPLRGLRGS